MFELSRRGLLAGALSAAALGGLSACGKDSGGDGPKAGESVPTSGTVKVWCWDPAFNIYAMKEAGKVYAKKSPDVKLNVVETPWDDIQTKITTLAQSKKGSEMPDIFLVQNNAFQKNVINYPDLFADLTDSGINFGDFPESVVNYDKIDGKIYGLPFDNGTAVQPLRIDFLQQCGLSMKDFTDITWSQYIELGKTIKGKLGKPLMSTQTGTSDLIMMMLQSAGASLFGEDEKAHIEDNDVVHKVVEVYKELITSGVCAVVNSWDQYIGGFTNNNHVGTINGVWILGSVQTAKDQSGKWEITNIPKLEGVDNATNYSANGGSSWAVSPNGNAALAVDVLKETFAGSTEFYDTILPSSGAIANWIPAGKSDVYKKELPFFNNTAVYSQVLEFSGKVPSNRTGVYYYEARDAVAAAGTKVIKGTDIKAALAEAQKTVDFAMK